tara:strand:+ start:295 stop:798 length:504 start_codon:yes stop_codon:yes gene_type:complete
MNLILTYRITSLPEEIQRRILIFAYKLFWRNFTPITAKIPSWYHHKCEIETMIYQSRLKNIHFLHLPFNTLERNKQWIMGCQCSFCVRKNKYRYIQKLYKKQAHDSFTFTRLMPHACVSWCNWEDYIDDELCPDIRQYYYDPLCGSYYEDKTKYALRTNQVKIDFIS